MKIALNAFAAAAIFATTGVHAVIGGADPRVTPMVNPWTNQQVQEWKFVGTYAGQSAVQIAPSWILISDHPDSNHLGSVFANTSGQSATSFCPMQNLCRLSTPIPAPAGVAFPPLVESPPQEERSRMSLHGVLLGVGNGGGFSAAWSELDGVPFAYMPAPAAAKVAGLATPSEDLIFTDNTVPITTGGDSGGAMYWYSRSGKPALSGIIEKANSFNVATDSKYPFTTAFITQVRSAIANAGDVPVAYRAITEQSEEEPLTPPFVSGFLSSSGENPTHTRFTWTRPSGPGSETITGYRIQLATQASPRGHAGQVVRSGWTSTRVLSYDFNNLNAAAKYIACVVPENSHGIGSSVLAKPSIITSGCKTFYAGTPPTINFFNISLSPISGTTNNAVSGSWSPVQFTGLQGYRYYISWRKDDGNLTTLQVDTTATSFSGAGSIPVGKQVCLQVTAVSTAGVESERAYAKCTQ